MKTVLFALLAACELVVIASGCDTQTIIYCTKTNLQKLTNITSAASGGQAAFINATCTWAEGYKNCLNPALKGCPADQVKNLRDNFSKYNESPYNCNVTVSGPGPVVIPSGCDTQTITDCTNTNIPKLTKITSALSGGQAAVIKATCTWAEGYKNCLNPALKGCPADEVKKLRDSFSKYNESPFNCNVTVSGPAITATVFTIVAAAIFSLNFK